MHGSQIFTRAIGRSVEGRALVAEANFDLAAGPPPHWTLLIGGQHGDEPATVRLLEDFRTAFSTHGFPPVTMVTAANPDGVARATRCNARGVDLNRNCGFNWRADSDEPSGSGPWSEPESCALRDFILGGHPAKIISLHWALAELDADGTHSTTLAESMWAALTPAQRAPYRLRITELGRGQRRLQETYAECPGSLGQWCGYALRYPDGSTPAMITLELPYDPQGTARPESLPPDHLETVRALWAGDEAGYLRAVSPGVHAMLVAACHFAGSRLG